jgi:hypothetical protein
MRAVLRVLPGSGACRTTPSDQGVPTLDRLAGGPFVGRAREIGSLLAAFEASTVGCGQLRMVVGEAGIGKTRLAASSPTAPGVRARSCCGADAGRRADRPRTGPG